MSRIISPGNLYSKFFEFIFLFNHMHEFLHFYLFIYFSRGLITLILLICYFYPWIFCQSFFNLAFILLIFSLLLIIFSA